MGNNEQLRKLDRWALGFLLLIAFLFWIAAFFLPQADLPTLLAIAAVLFIGGIPHACLDHEVYRRLSPQPQMPAFIVAYTGLALVFVGVWILSPPMGFALFYLITWIHWGQGDLDFDRFVLESDFRTPVDRILFVITRGAAPMSLPLLADPDTVVELISLCLLLLSDSSPLPSISLIQIAGITGAVIFLSGSAIISCRYRRQRKRHLLETSLLVLLFLSLNPLISIGLYFLFWHSSRHLIRLASEFSIQDRDSVRRLFQAAFPILAVSAVLTAATMGVAYGFVGLLFVFPALLFLIYGLTFPHTLIIYWTNARRGVTMLGQ